MLSKQDADPDTERLFGRIVEDVILFAVCCYLVKLGVSFLVSVRIPLLIIAVLGIIAVITYRVLRWRNRHDDY